MRRSAVKAPRGWHLMTPPRWKQSITQIFHLRGVPPATSEVTTIVVLLLIHLFLLINLRFEAWPEMVIYPYLMHHGFRLYTDIVNPYPPLFTWFLAGFFKLTGLSLLNLKILTWGLIVLIDLLIYRIALKKYGRSAALVSLTFFIVLQPLLDGNGLWFDLALVPILLLAFYRQSPLALVLGFFIKQSIIWFFPLMHSQWKKLFIGITGLFALCSLFTPWRSFTGLFPLSGSATDYLFWAWRFPFTLAPFMPGYKDFGNFSFWRTALVAFSPVIVIFLLGAKRPQKYLTIKNPLVWSAISLTFLFPRFGLFHLQPALAFTALFIGLSWSKLWPLFQKYSLFKVAVAIYVLMTTALWGREVKLFWHQPTRFFEPHVYESASTIQQLTTADQELFLLNTPAQILWLSQRLPSKPWVDTFPWYYEVPGVQEKIIAALSLQLPPAVIFSPYQDQSPFTPGSYRPQKVDDFINQTYESYTPIGSNIQLWQLK